MASYNTIIKNVTVQKEQTFEKHYELTHTTFFIDSSSRAQKTAHIKNQWIRRIVFGVLTAGFSGAGYHYNTQARYGVTQLDNIQANYSAATTDFGTYKTAYNAEKNIVNSNEQKRNILYGLAGACAVGFGVSIWF